MIQKAEILSFLIANKSLFKKQFSVIKIGIFGSFARGQQTNESDIDIIIEMPRGTDDIFEKKQNLKFFLKNHFHREIDICRERSIKPLFKEMIFKDVIYV